MNIGIIYVSFLRTARCVGILCKYTVTLCTITTFICVSLLHNYIKASIIDNRCQSYAQYKATRTLELYIYVPLIVSERRSKNNN